MTTNPNTTRDEALLAAAVHLAQTTGYANLTRDAIAAQAQVAGATVSNYKRTQITNQPDRRSASAMVLLREDVMQWAVDNGELTILRAGLAADHPIALGADDQLRIAALTA